MLKRILLGGIVALTFGGTLIFSQVSPGGGINPGGGGGINPGGGGINPGGGGGINPGDVPVEKPTKPEPGSISVPCTPTSIKFPVVVSKPGADTFLTFPKNFPYTFATYQIGFKNLACVTLQKGTNVDKLNVIVNSRLKEVADRLFKTIKLFSTSDATMIEYKLRESIEAPDQSFFGLIEYRSWYISEIIQNLIKK